MAVFANFNSEIKLEHFFLILILKNNKKSLKFALRKHEFILLTSISCVYRYLTDIDAAYPLIFCGVSGSGKTVALASVVQQCHAWNQNAAVVARFANASVYSSTLEQTLHSLAVQLDLVDSGKSTWFKHVSFFYINQTNQYTLNKYIYK